MKNQSTNPHSPLPSGEQLVLNPNQEFPIGSFGLDSD